MLKTTQWNWKDSRIQLGKRHDASVDADVVVGDANNVPQFNEAQ